MKLPERVAAIAMLTVVSLYPILLAGTAIEAIQNDKPNGGVALGVLSGAFVVCAILGWEHFIKATGGEMAGELNGAFGALRLLSERKAVIEARVTELRIQIGFYEKELETLRPAERELRKSIIPLEEVKDEGS